MIAVRAIRNGMPVLFVNIPGFLTKVITVSRLTACGARRIELSGSELLSLYLSDFANYSATYGSLGAAIGLMTWMWLSAIIILVGAELNSEIERHAALRTARIES